MNDMLTKKEIVIHKVAEKVEAKQWKVKTVYNGGTWNSQLWAEKDGKFIQITSYDYDEMPKSRDDPEPLKETNRFFYIYPNDIKLPTLEFLLNWLDEFL